MRKLIRNRKGQGLVEYALIIAGVALIGIVGITMFGHKVADLIGTVAAILPGAHTDDNGPIVSGHLIGTTTMVERRHHDRIDATQRINPRTPAATTAGRDKATHARRRNPSWLIDCKDEAARNAECGLAARHGNQWPVMNNDRI